jgi:hypothetical protein
MLRMLDWNGRDIPHELRRLPAGRYVVEPADDVPDLSPAEEEGLRQAMASIREGRGVRLEAARRRVAVRSTRG